MTKEKRRKTFQMRIDDEVESWMEALEQRSSDVSRTDIVKALLEFAVNNHMEFRPRGAKAQLGHLYRVQLGKEASARVLAGQYHTEEEVDAILRGEPSAENLLAAEV